MHKHLSSLGEIDIATNGLAIVLVKTNFYIQELKMDHVFLVFDVVFFEGLLKAIDELYS